MLPVTSAPIAAGGVMARQPSQRCASDPHAGTTGLMRSTMPASAGVRSPLRWLQGAHALTVFGQVFCPPRAGQDVVDRHGRTLAVAAPPFVAGQDAALGPGGALRVPPPGDDVPDEPDHLRHGEHADELVGFGFVDLGDPPAEHPDRVGDRDPVERAEVGVDDENGVHWH